MSTEEERHAEGVARARTALSFVELVADELRVEGEWPSTRLAFTNPDGVSCALTVTTRPGERTTLSGTSLRVDERFVDDDGRGLTVDYLLLALTRESVARVSYEAATNAEVTRLLELRSTHSDEDLRTACAVLDVDFPLPPETSPRASVVGVSAVLDALATGVPLEWALRRVETDVPIELAVRRLGERRS